MNSLRLTAAALLVLSACSSSTGGSPPGTGDDGEDGDRDRTAPLLQVDTPLRGTLTDGSTVIVTGSVSDESGDVEVTVNGQPANVSGGQFDVTLTVPTGMTLIQTVAVDAAGNDAEDIRALLAGSFAPQGTPVSDGIVARVSENELDILGGMVESLANDTDFGAVARSQNPLANTGGTSCNNISIVAKTLTMSDVIVSASPTAGGIDVDIKVMNPDATMDLPFRAVCVSGSTSAHLWASQLRVKATLRMSLSASGNVQITMANETASFTGFNLDVGALPGFADNWVEGMARDKIIEVLRDELLSMAPPMAESFLAEFLADSWNVFVLGQTVQIAIKPTRLDFAPSGGTIVLQTNVNLEGVAGADYLVTPESLPTLDAMAPGLRLGLADDVANQVLAGFWASGALEQEIPADSQDAIGAFFGDDADRVTVRLMLPPVLRADMSRGATILTVGDVMVDVIDDDGGNGTLATFAVSAEIPLRVETAADGRVTIVTDEPTIWGKVLEKSPAITANLNDQTVTGLAKLVIDQITDGADGMLESLPLPTFGGATFTSPTIDPAIGYLLIGAQVE